MPHIPNLFRRAANALENPHTHTHNTSGLPSQRGVHEATNPADDARLGDGTCGDVAGDASTAIERGTDDPGVDADGDGAADDAADGVSTAHERGTGDPGAQAGGRGVVGGAADDAGAGGDGERGVSEGA